MKGQGVARRVEDHGGSRSMTDQGEAGRTRETDEVNLVELREHGAKEALEGRKAKVASRAQRTEMEPQDRNHGTEMEIGKSTLPSGENGGRAKELKGTIRRQSQKTGQLWKRRQEREVGRKHRHRLEI